MMVIPFIQHIQNDHSESGGSELDSAGGSELDSAGDSVTLDCFLNL